MIPWIMIAIALIIVVLGMAMILFYRKNKMPPTDYYVFFIIGIIWAIAGIIPLMMGEYQNSFFVIMGLAFMALGIQNKKHWKRNHRTWKQLSKQEQKLKIIILIILGVLVLIGLIAFIAAAR